MLARHFSKVFFLFFKTKKKLDKSELKVDVAPLSQEKPSETGNKVDLRKETKSSGYSFLYSFMPEQILGVPVDEIKKDIVEGKTQIASL